MMKRSFLAHFLAAIASLAALATLITVLFDVDCIKECWAYGTFWAILVVLISFGYACWQTRSKKKISLDMSSELKLTISEGDLFEKKGIICIPVNEYFDTHVGDNVVNENSIHGQFITKYYKDRLDELQQKINTGLANKKCAEHPRRLGFCPDKRYDLGTCVDVRDGENTYVLFALTHFNDQDVANVGRTEYSQVVNLLMEHLSVMAEAKPVYMPLFGTKYSRMRRTSQRILLQLVNTIDFNDTCTIPGGVHIVIDSHDKLDVNLTLLEHVITNGISK